MSKKVLITVFGGVASAFAEPDVDVVILDFDDLDATDPDDIIPIHSDFLPLMEFANVHETGPLSEDGRVNDAENIGLSTDSSSEFTLRFKSISTEHPPFGVSVLCVMSRQPERIKGIRQRVLLLSQDFQSKDLVWLGEAFQGKHAILDFDCVDKWSYLPISLGGNHVA